MKTTMTTRTYTIRGRAYIEATQRGYAVLVDTKERPRGQIAHYDDHGTTAGMDEAYRLASALAESIRRGRGVWSRGDWTFVLNGRRLKATKTR